MRMVATNSVAAAAAGGRSTLLLLLIFVTDHLRTSLGSNDSLPVVEDPRYKSLDPDLRRFLMEVDAKRIKTSASIMDFDFDINRVQVISKAVRIPLSKNGIMYWMNRDHRVQDNWAFLYAQRLAIRNQAPLHIVVCTPRLVVDASYRQYKIMCKGLKQVEIECQQLNIEFHFLFGNSTQRIAHFAKTRVMGAIVVDFSPFPDDLNTLKQLVNKIGHDIPVLHADAHNVIPCWILSEKQLGANRLNLRKRINNIERTYITEFPPVIKHPYTAFPKARPTNWSMVFSNHRIERIPSVPNFRAGYIPAMGALLDFITNKLKNYEINRNNPLIDGLSNLSAWLHFGHISAQRVILEILKFEKIYPKNAFVFKEEVLNRRELLENYVYYNPYYNRIEGGPLWALDSINKHRNDTRPTVYTRDEFENGQTESFLWNACHNQMKMEGKTHRYLRPFWAKKILEYSNTPEEAIVTANYLNNKYSLDGNDPAAYGGILWAIIGLFDQRCKERAIFGRIRYLNSTLISRNFDYKAYILKYKGALQGEETRTETAQL